MTDEQAIAILERGIPGDGVTREQIQEATARAVSALRAVHVDTNKMVPLTIEQLREMDGQPVWVTPTGFWALVIAKKEKRVELICNDGETVYADKYIELVVPVYAYPPANIDREAWGCPNCTPDSDGYVRKFGAYSIQDSMLETGHCKPQEIKYCPKCGRPLTPEAWDELEKRMGVISDG